MDASVELFLSGLVLGAGPCMLFCLPLLIPLVASTSKGWVEGIKATLAFSLSRLLAYTLLGLGAGFFGELLFDFIGQTDFSLIVWTIGGIFISTLGVLILLGEQNRFIACRTLRRHTIDHSLKSLVFIGFIVGVTPCVPLIGVLTHIALSVKSPLIGAFYALCFGLGASIVTPITALGVIAGGAPRIIFKTPRVHELFKKSCGLILILLGARQVYSQFTGGGLYY
jgi:sulfite exporter TauE/SafE